MHRTGECPHAGLGVIELSAGMEGAVGESAGSEDFPVAQQDRGTLLAWDLHSTTELPDSVQRIVDFRAADRIERTIKTSADENLSIGQGNSEVASAREAERTAGAP